MAAANQAHDGKACVRHHCVGVSYASWQSQPHGYHVHLAESAPLSFVGVVPDLAVHLPHDCAYNGNTKGLKLENHVGHPSGA